MVRANEYKPLLLSTTLRNPQRIKEFLRIMKTKYLQTTLFFWLSKILLKKNYIQLYILVKSQILCKFIFTEQYFSYQINLV